VAAAVIAAVLLVGNDWGSVEEPGPVDDDVPVRTLTPGRGIFDKPASIDAGVWSVRIQDHQGAERSLLVDVPPGWGQDDDVALSTGAPEDPTTRGFELSADLTGVYRGPCKSRTTPAGDTAREQAHALATMPGVEAGSVEPASLDGHAGYQVSLRPPAELDGRGGACVDGMATLYRSQSWPMYIKLGWTALVRVVDVDGHVLVVSAVHGPDASQADIDELVRMVDTAQLADPTPEPD